MIRLWLLVYVWSIWLYAQEYLVSDIKEYKRVVKSIKAGDSIVLKDGIWRDVRLILKGVGTAKKPIVLKAQTPSKVIITGKSSLLMYGKFLIVRDLVFKDGEPAVNPLISIGTSKHLARYCRFTHNVIDNFNRKNLDEKYHWVRVVGYHNRVDHSKFTHMKNRGVTIKVYILKHQAPNYTVIDHNEFSFRTQGNKNGYETIRIGNSKVSLQSSKALVKDNLFYHCDGEIEIISNKSCDNSYIHNTFKNCNGMLTLRHGNNCIVKDNFFINNDASYMGGVRVIGENHKIINNFFYKVGVSPLRASISLINSKKNEPLYGYRPVKNILIYHNIFIDTQYTIFSGANFKNGLFDIVPYDVDVISNLFIRTKKVVDYIGVVAKLNLKDNIKSDCNISYYQEKMVYPIDLKNIGTQ